MRVCFDTSVVIDILGKTAWFEECFASYDVAMLRRFEACLTVSSATDIAYVLHSRGVFSKQQARDALDTVFSLFDLLDIVPADCRNAYRCDMDDYEDALISHTALRHGVDLIVTRNKKDFAHSPVTALTPGEFVAAYKPDNIEYSSISV